jgi:hypothetical protein
MNQRLSRNKDSHNKVGFVSIGTGGYVNRHSPNEQPEVQVPPPMKATGDIKPEEPVKGAAKASPNFKPIVPQAKAMDKKDEKVAIEKNSKPVDEDKDE